MDACCDTVDRQPSVANRGMEGRALSSSPSSRLLSSYAWYSTSANSAQQILFPYPYVLPFGPGVRYALSQIVVGSW